MTSDFLKNYDISEPTIRKLYDSKLRLSILNALHDKPLRLADLRRVVNANAPNTSSKAKELEEMGILERIEGDFKLTPYGHAVRSKVEESLEFYSTYEKFREFWKTHDTSGIPDYLWARIGELSNSELTKNTETKPIFSHEEFVRILRLVKKFFYGVTPIYHDDYGHFLINAVRSGVDVQVVSTKEILDYLKKLPKGLIKDYREIATMKNFKTFLISEKISVGFSVSEQFNSLALDSKTASVAYMDMDLNSFDPRAIKWGLDLFDYYKKQAKPVNLKDYL